MSHDVFLGDKNFRLHRFFAFVVSWSDEKGIKSLIRALGVLISASLITGCMQLQPSLPSTGLILASSASRAHSSRIALATPSKRQIVIRNDPGGELVRYALLARKVEKAGETVRFRGRCDSACTLFLSIPPERLCITPGASFGFHLAYGASAHVNDVATKYMRSTYPRWVNKWIDAEGGLEATIKRMSFEYASRYIPACPRPAASAA